MPWSASQRLCDSECPSGCSCCGTVALALAVADRLQQVLAHVLAEALAEDGAQTDSETETETEPETEICDGEICDVCAEEASQAPTPCCKEGWLAPSSLPPRRGQAISTPPAP